MANIPEYHVRSQIVSNKYKFKWTVDKFSNLLYEFPIKMETVFKVLPDVRFISTFEKQDYFLLWTMKVVDPKEFVVVRHDISILDDSDNVVLKKEVLHRYDEVDDLWFLIDECDELSELLSLENEKITLITTMTCNSYIETVHESDETCISSTETAVHENDEVSNEGKEQETICMGVKKLKITTKNKQKVHEIEEFSNGCKERETIS